MSTQRLKCLRPALAPTTTAGGWKPDIVRGSRHQRGYGWVWEKTRERILDRDCNLCQPCLRTQRVTVATQVDHIIPKAAGGTDDESNLQAICVPCHAEKTARESQNPGGEGR